MRENFSTGGAAPLSKSVIVPFAWRRASCCHANLVPAPMAKLLFLPPRRQSTFFVLRSISYNACVLRAETRKLPLGSTSMELMWK